MYPNNVLYLHENEEDFKLSLEAIALLRRLFLSLPFAQFTDVKVLRTHLPEHRVKYLSSLSTYLDFGTDSFRYHMLYLNDDLTGKVYDRDEDHYYHTDMWGRIDQRLVKGALAYAMGFKSFQLELDVEKYGYERDFGYVEETLDIDGQKYQIYTHKNANGRYHGYSEIVQEDGSLQRCFFDDGKILARKIAYANGLGEDLKNCDSIAVDIYAPRMVYEVVDPAAVAENDSDLVYHCDGLAIRQVMADRTQVEKLFQTLCQYTLKMEYRHFVQYPYDEGEWETEKRQRIPALDMAVLKDGELDALLFKTNGKSLVSPDYQPHRYWEMYIIAIDDEIQINEYTFSCLKKDKE